MLSPADQWFARQEEPAAGCLLFLRQHVLQKDARITEAWKYGMPFFCIGNKMCCYLWMHIKYKQPYLGFVEGKQLQHQDLLQEKRSRMKILLIDPQKDIPVQTIDELLEKMLAIYLD